MKKRYLIFLILTAFLLCGTIVQCDDGHMKPPPVENGNDDDDDDDDGDDDDDDPEGYPKGLSVVPFADELGSSKCTGFYAVVDFDANPRLSFRPQWSKAKKPTAYFADFTGGKPWVVINGGYFGGATSVSLLVDEGTVKSSAAQVETSGGVSYHISRAALGQMEDGSFEAAWVYCTLGSVHYAFPAALDNDESEGRAVADAPTGNSPGAVWWRPQAAIGGGPMLVYGGKNVAVENTDKEVFRAIAGRNPRTAIGVTADRKLILLVCDGRGKQGSVGFTLAELADKMLALGCTYAVNLDGGGSSTFVGREGKVLNMPSDTAGTTTEGATIVERSMPTAVVIAEK